MEFYNDVVNQKVSDNLRSRGSFEGSVRCLRLSCIIKIQNFNCWIFLTSNILNYAYYPLECERKWRSPVLLYLWRANRYVCEKNFYWYWVILCLAVTNDWLFLLFGTCALQIKKRVIKILKINLDFLRFQMNKSQN